MTDNLAGQIRRDLWSIKDTFDEALQPARRATGSHVTTTKQPPLPIAAHVLDVRADTRRDLIYWTGFIIDNVRDINGDQLQHTPRSLDVDVLVPFIATWVDWLITNTPDDADNLASETSKHARSLRGIVQETGTRRFPIGGCPEHGVTDMGERVPCAGELRALLRKDDDLLPSEVACTVDTEHRWPASEWMQLGRRIIMGLTG